MYFLRNYFKIQYLSKRLDWGLGGGGGQFGPVGHRFETPVLSLSGLGGWRHVLMSHFSVFSSQMYQDLTILVQVAESKRYFSNFI